MSTILKIERLSHRYASTWAVRDLNLEIKDKGIVGLLGSNGAGKSTTMNIICGVLNQTEGRVLIKGIDIRQQPIVAKKHIGFLPQTPPVYLDLTVDEYLRTCAELRLMEKDRIRAAVEEAKEKTSITHFSGRLIRNLSGGYRQRVGIAQAIVHKPDLVVLDEPTNGLDPNQLIEARKLIREIAQERTVIFSSHIMSEINFLCREVIMIESGRVVFSDTMDAFNNYLKPQTILLTMEHMPQPAELLQISGISRAEALSAKQMRIWFNGDEELSERLIDVSKQNGWKLREITIEKGMLDDVFKQLSNHSAQ